MTAITAFLCPPNLHPKTPVVHFLCIKLNNQIFCYCSFKHTSMSQSKTSIFKDCDTVLKTLIHRIKRDKCAVIRCGQ